MMYHSVYDTATRRNVRQQNHVRANANYIVLYTIRACRKQKKIIINKNGIKNIIRLRRRRCCRVQIRSGRPGRGGEGCRTEATVAAVTVRRAAMVTLPLEGEVEAVAEVSFSRGGCARRRQAQSSMTAIITSGTQRGAALSLLSRVRFALFRSQLYTVVHVSRRRAPSAGSLSATAFRTCEQRERLTFSRYFSQTASRRFFLPRSRVAALRIVPSVR